ncbi:MAG: hypothetical protein HC880_13380 [Bacteroidia bacterium]|nr:hypothetical protein [Bacteroidia bacterium]
MKIESVEQGGLEDVVRIGHDGDSIILAYLKEHELYSKMVHRYNEVREEYAQDIKEELFQNHLVSETLWDELIHWYGPYFLYLGEQRLKNQVDLPAPSISASTGSGTDTSTSSLINTNKVFHLSKLRYFPQEPSEEDKEKEKEKNKTKEEADKGQQ